MLAATANPAHPDEVDVSRPSDALEARAATDRRYALFLGLGAVALLVGGIGIANVMVISVLERRSEIGLRRRSAPPRHVGAQFLTESLILAALGGLAGLAGRGGHRRGGRAQGWSVSVPAVALAAAWRRRWRSAPSRGCTRRSGRRGCRRPTR